ncbi:ROK family protein [Spiroplasma endosymbiont of Labia minor]|uniref:ROK family protein n=1 Tax=Spiroplasma endosymbiont of Labia minor TaxID=3066305 RepID=UPI0030D5B55D
MEIIGIDLGGTSAKIGLVNEFGETLMNFQIENSKTNLWENIKDKIIAHVSKQRYEQVVAIGFASAGFIDHKNGIIKAAYNLNLKNVNLSSLSKTLFEKPTFVINDANAAVLGEWWIGAGKQYESVVFYTIGTGIGGGLVLNNKLVIGHHGFAGEFGHGGYFQDIKKCNCGLSNCVEIISSSINIESHLKHLFEIHPEWEWWNLFENQPIKFADIVAIGDVKTKIPELDLILKECFKPLAKQMSSLIYSIDPDQIILGGGGSNLGNYLIDMLKNLCKSYVNEELYYTHDWLSISKLKNNAGYIGAAYWALTQFQSEQ